MPVVERRNLARRANATRLVVNALADAGGYDALANLHAWMLPPGAAGRILKRLAVRGLARIMPTGWSATPPLLSPVPLQRVETSDGDFAVA